MTMGGKVAHYISIGHKKSLVRKKMKYLLHFSHHGTANAERKRNGKKISSLSTILGNRRKRKKMRKNTLKRSNKKGKASIIFGVVTVFFLLFGSSFSCV